MIVLWNAHWVFSIDRGAWSIENIPIYWNLQAGRDVMHLLLSNRNKLIADKLTQLTVPVILQELVAFHCDLYSGGPNAWYVHSFLCFWPLVLPWNSSQLQNWQETMIIAVGVCRMLEHKDNRPIYISSIKIWFSCVEISSGACSV